MHAKLQPSHESFSASSSEQSLVKHLLSAQWWNHAWVQEDIPSGWEAAIHIKHSRRYFDTSRVSVSKRILRNCGVLSWKPIGQRSWRVGTVTCHPQ